MKPSTLKTICDIHKQRNRHKRLTIIYEVMKYGKIVERGCGDPVFVCEALSQLHSSFKNENSNAIEIIAFELQKQEEIKSRANIRIEELEYSLAEALGRKHL